MSAEAVGYVYRFSPYRGAAFSVHAAVADSVNDQNENEFYMRQEKLARKARVGRQAANNALAALEADGYLGRLGELEGARGVVLWRFIFKPGQVVFDTRGRVARGDRNQSPPTTGDLSSTTTQNPSEDPKGKEPSPQAARARAITTVHWDRCKAEGRPTPVVQRGRAGSDFIAIAKIVERLLDAGWDDEAITAALWATEGGHTLQGLGVQLTKSRARCERAAALEAPPDDRGARPLWTDRPDCPLCDGVGMRFDEAANAAVRCECNPEAA